MIHEHEATQFASAAMDFPLADHEERWLQAELADCPVCAERATAYHEQLRLLQRLPVMSASDATRVRITQAALSGRTDTRSPMMLALAAALLVGLLLALTAAAGALLTNRDELSAIPTAPPSPLASAPLVAGSAEPSAPAVAAGGGFTDTLEHDSIVEVVSGDLRVRSKPSVASDSTKFTPLLQTGDRLFVIDGPVIADDYAWYQVAPVGTDPSEPSSDLPTGWVSRGDHDGAPWIAPAATDCPQTPFDIASLNDLHPLERVACFGDQRMSFPAVINGGAQSGWIADSRLNGYLDSDVQNLAVAIEPGTGMTAEGLPDGRVATLEGSFDNPSCANRGDPDAVLDCRGVFVVASAALDPVDLRKNDLAITTTDDLRVRERPLVEDDGKLELLPNGTRLAVIGGPAVGSGYAWYQVVVPSIRTADGSPRVGWVAAHDPNGEEWIGEETFDCQDPADITIEELGFLTSPEVAHGGLACYGAGAPYAGAELTVDGRARVECSGPPPSASHWLMDHEKRLVLIDGASEVRGVMQNYPDSLHCDADAGQMLYRATGHFDDPESGVCRRPGAAGDPDDVAVYECRSQFVVTDVSVTGPGSSRAPGAP